MKNGIDMHCFTSRDELVGELVLAITTLLAEGIRQNGRASLAVSGGSTPVQLFKRLAKADLDWSSVDICLVDERWVDGEDPASNAHLVQKYLLQNKACEAKFTGMKNEASTASAGQDECGRQLEGVHHPYDALILGMGDDGHTASLFPKALKLREAVTLDSGLRCISIAPLTAPHERMTLTLPEILSAQQIFLHIVGQNKKDVLEQACLDGPPEEMPIRFILEQFSKNQKTAASSLLLHIYWAK